MTFPGKYVYLYYSSRHLGKLVHFGPALSFAVYCLENSTRASILLHSLMCLCIPGSSAVRTVICVAENIFDFMLLTAAPLPIHTTPFVRVAHHHTTLATRCHLGRRLIREIRLLCEQGVLSICLYDPIYYLWHTATQWKGDSRLLAHSRKQWITI